ncbi:MAG: hypothetical protein JW908_16965 [Anaerolineales bacterium]|nr:hypothetical protein [Anaerolineales bacterium]
MFYYLGFYGGQGRVGKSLWWQVSFAVWWRNREIIKPKKTAPMNFVDKYPILYFIVLAWVFSAGTILLVIQGVIPVNMALSSAFSASVVGIIMTALLDGKAGLKWMFSRLLIWQVGIGYWLFAFLFL